MLSHVEEGHGLQKCLRWQARTRPTGPDVRAQGLDTAAGLVEHRGSRGSMVGYMSYRLNSH